MLGTVGAVVVVDGGVTVISQDASELKLRPLTVSTPLAKLILNSTAPGTVAT